MRVNQRNAARCFLASLTGLLVLAIFGLAASRAVSDVRQPVAIQFTLDRPIDAGAAPFVMAAARGMFASEGLAVTTNIASGSQDAIPPAPAPATDSPPAHLNPLIPLLAEPH